MPPTAKTTPAPTVSDAELKAVLPKLRARLATLEADIEVLKAQHVADKRASAEASESQSRLTKLRAQLGPDSPHFRQALYNEAKRRVATGRAPDLGTAIGDLEREMS